MDDLKTQIYKTTKEFMAEYGYEKTTFQMVADKLKITKGAITYHFQNKHLIGALIIEEYYSKYKQYILSFKDEYVNSYWKYCVMYIYSYNTVFKSVKNTELFYNKSQIALWTKSVVKLVAKNYIEIAKEFNKNDCPEVAKMNALLDLGARSFMYDRYLEDSSYYSPEKLLYYHIAMMGSLSKLDEKTITDSISKAYQFVEKHNDVKIDLF